MGHKMVPVFTVSVLRMVSFFMALRPSGVTPVDYGEIPPSMKSW
jgi:hypothetical protein